MLSNCQRGLLFIYNISTESILFVEDLLSCSLWEDRRRAIAVQYALGRQEGWPTRGQLIEPAIVLSKENFLNLKQRRLFLPQVISLDFFKWKLNIVISSRFKASDI